MRAFVIRSSDIDRCPIRSFNPNHYRDDGSCLHVPPVDAPARPAQEVRPIKALSLVQPWASLVAEGIKTVESRSWQTHYRGPLAIAASASIPTDVRHRVLGHRIRGRHNSYGQGDARIQNALYEAGYEDGGVPDGKPLPLGCAMATCRLVDVLPIHEQGCQCDYTDGLYLLHGFGAFGEIVGLFESPGGAGVQHPEWKPSALDCLADAHLRQQAPFGDFACGRYGWLLDDVRKLDPPVPVKGRQGLWEWNASEGGRTALPNAILGG